MLHQISQFWQNSTKAGGTSSSCMYWIPPSLPLQSLSCPTPTVCGTDEGAFGRVYADFITNFPLSLRFQFLQECRLRDQLLAHSKPGLPVTILAFDEDDDDYHRYSQPAFVWVGK